MKFDVVCFGSAVVDALVETDAKEVNGYIMFPHECKMLVKNLCFEIGGGGTNTAVAFSRLGLRTGYIGKIGNDKNGGSVLDLLKNEKISFLGKKISGKTSGFSVVLISKERHRSILTYKGINDTIESDDVKNFETDWLYFSSMMKKSFRTQLALAKKFKKNGTKIAFNPSEYIIGKEDLNPLLKICDILILNKEEAELLTKEKDKLKGIHNLGPKIVVITDERNAVYCYDGKKTYSINPPKVKIADKTGAGDAFSAGFVAGLIKNKPIDFCLNLGVKEAISTIKYLGAKNNLLRMKLR